MTRVLSQFSIGRERSFVTQSLWLRFGLPSGCSLRTPHPRMREPSRRWWGRRGGAVKSPWPSLHFGIDNIGSWAIKEPNDFHAIRWLERNSLDMITGSSRCRCGLRPQGQNTTFLLANIAREKEQFGITLAEIDMETRSVVLRYSVGFAPTPSCLTLVSPTQGAARREQTMTAEKSRVRLRWGSGGSSRTPLI